MCSFSVIWARWFSFNVGCGLGFLNVMVLQEEALQGYIARDVAISTHFWSQRFFQKQFWDKLEIHERQLPAIFIGGFRCALDKALWRHYLDVKAPNGMTWREYGRQKRQEEDLRK